MTILWWGYGGGGGGAGSPPATPTLAVNSAGTLATITGSDGGSTNTLAVLSASFGVGSPTWVDEGIRTGDGTVPLTLENGWWWAKVTSVTAGGSAVSNLVYFRVGVPSGTLEHSPADILGQLLVLMGVGTEPTDDLSWPVYVANEPDLPDNCITVYDTAGRDDGRMQVSGERAEHHGVQVRIRSTTHPIGYLKAREVAVALDEDVYQEGVTFDSGESYTVHSVSRTGDVLPLGKESPTSERRLFTVNAVICLKQLVS